MNKTMRKQLSEVLALLDKIDTAGIEQTLTDLQAEEQDKFDNLSDGLQSTDKGIAIETAAENLEAALDAVADIGSAIDEARTYIEAAQE